MDDRNGMEKKPLPRNDFLNYYMCIRLKGFQTVKTENVDVKILVGSNYSRRLLTDNKKKINDHHGLFGLVYHLLDNHL